MAIPKGCMVMAIILLSTQVQSKLYFLYFFISIYYIFSSQTIHCIFLFTYIFPSLAIYYIYMFTYIFFTGHRLHIYVHIYFFFTGHTLHIYVHIYFFFTGHTLHIAGEREKGIVSQNYSLRCSVGSQQTVSGDIHFYHQTRTKILTIATLRQNGSECFVVSPKPIHLYVPSCDKDTSDSSSASQSYTLRISQLSKTDIGTWFCIFQNRTSNSFYLEIRSKL